MHDQARSFTLAREEGEEACQALLRTFLTLEKPAGGTFHGANLPTSRRLFPSLGAVLAVPDSIARRPAPVSCLLSPSSWDRLLISFERSDDVYKVWQRRSQGALASPLSIEWNWLGGRCLVDLPIFPHNLWWLNTGLARALTLGQLSRPLPGRQASWRSGPLPPTPFPLRCEVCCGSSIAISASRYMLIER